ncbi:hypothetical protein GCM10010259_14420 [Streptomyces daghestanicus]|uniref:Uncharacterized protein n=1 Tax=Streptomyces daghestanicus TaxID=66885 RepID=A0ABQ3Q542_9ACTN|nr:hypothetical protein GCM10010259_14420 [Streptomyces daghestanicus]GHI32374.1 hypothetical protein Sdagh_41040 [Streptomyces daghestanicus]
MTGEAEEGPEPAAASAGCGVRWGSVRGAVRGAVGFVRGAVECLRVVWGAV